MKAACNEPIIQIEYFNINHISHVFKGKSGSTSFTLLNDEELYETIFILTDLMELLNSHYLDS